MFFSILNNSFVVKQSLYKYLSDESEELIYFERQKSILILKLLLMLIFHIQHTDKNTNFFHCTVCVKNYINSSLKLFLHIDY